MGLQSKVTDAPNQNQFGQIIQIWPHLTLLSHPKNGLYHSVSPCHSSNRIHISLIIQGWIYLWVGDGLLPCPPSCHGSDPDSYTVLLYSPIGRVLHRCIVALWPWNSQHLVQSCYVTAPAIKMSIRCFSTAEKSTIFCKFPCFSLLLRAPVCPNGT